MRQRKQTTPPLTDAAEEALPNADASTLDTGYAAALGKRAKATLKKQQAKEVVNASVLGSSAYAKSNINVAQPNTQESVWGYINVNPPPRPMFSTVTAKGVKQSEINRPFIKAACKVQKMPMVTLRPGATSSMEIMIIRRGRVRSNIANVATLFMSTQ